MLMKIEISHPENISPPPKKKYFKSPEQTQHHGNNTNPSRKNPKHFRKHLHPSKKIKTPPGKISTSLKNSPSPKIA